MIMGTQIVNLWPEDIGRNIDQSTPLTILKQQASLLGQRTKNLVEAMVVSEMDGEFFVHSFILIAPALGHYRYLLFRVLHKLDIYPLHIKTDVDSKPPQYIASTEDEFIDQLKEVFSAEKTRKVIDTLLAMSKK